MRITELRRIMKQIVQHQQEVLDGLEHEKNNPTVRDMYHEIQGELNMARAVLDSMCNNTVDLKLRLPSCVKSDG